MTSLRPRIDARPTEAQRLHGLLDAQRLITADLSLVSVLDRIVAAACDLVGAKYGALGVLAADGSIEHFVHRGLDAAVVGRAGELPHGLLGAVLDTPFGVRVDDVRRDPRAGRFAARYPAMRSFLGVPIRVRGEAFGELYVADPEVGRFDIDDSDLLTALAASAGSAIANARLFGQAQRSRDWLTASGEVARALLADADEAVLLGVVSRALEVAEADYAALILPTDDGRLQVIVATGAGADDFHGLVFDPAASPLGRAIIAGISCRTTDMLDWSNPDFVNRHGYGPAMLAPLVDVRGIRGAVLLIRQTGRLPFTTEDVQHASTFAAQVALALELNDARADAEWLRVVEDRHRIAEDLHDNVIQRLFATGMGLQMLSEQGLDGEPGDRLRRHIADLDETIEQIRLRVFGLREPDDADVRRRRGRYPRVRTGTAGPAAPARGADPASLRRLSTPGVRPPDPPEQADR